MKRSLLALAFFAGTIPCVYAQTTDKNGATAASGTATATGGGTTPATGGTAGTATASGGAKPATAPAVPLAADALAVKPGSYHLDPDHGKITWSVNHLGFSTYVGFLPGVTADLTLDPKDIGRTTLTATIDMNSVDTGNASLNDHLKGEGFFDTKRYPQATFKSTKVTVTGPRTARIDGDLTLRGKTSPIVISATFNNAGVDPVDKRYTVGFDGASIIRRSTFGASEYVPMVGDDVLIRLEGEFKQAQ